jgi:hypothetical protein
MPSEDFGHIRELNDLFRTSSKLGDNVLVHSSLFAQGFMNMAFLNAVLQAIREQWDFDYDETSLHDFGTVVVNGQAIRWSIGYSSVNGAVTEPGAAAHRFLELELETA